MFFCSITISLESPSSLPTLGLPGLSLVLRWPSHYFQLAPSSNPRKVIKVGEVKQKNQRIFPTGGGRNPSKLGWSLSTYPGAKLCEKHKNPRFLYGPVGKRILRAFQNRFRHDSTRGFWSAATFNKSMLLVHNCNVPMCDTRQPTQQHLLLFIPSRPFCVRT